MTETEDFTVGRNNPLENVDRAELNNLLGSVASAFGTDWLAMPSGLNRIQTLWSRQDALATNQLALLGDALKRLAPLNTDWVDTRIYEIKSESTSNRKGDLFELLGLSLFAVGGQRVTGAREHNPGYDGTIDCGNGALASVSLKDHGVSSHQAIFKTQAASIEREIVTALHSLQLNGLSLRIDASRFPLQADWDWLHRAIPRALSDWRSDWTPRQGGGTWTLTPQPLPNGDRQFAEQYLSYALTMTAPHHSNEQQNIETKIEKACVNLAKHANAAAVGTARLLLIRIPDTTSSAGCVACARRWLQDRPNAQVDGVILYQPAVAAPSNAAPAGIVHFVAVVMGPGFERWRHIIGRPGFAIQARVLVGSCTDQPTILVGLDGSKLGERYVYQRGQIYLLSQVRPDGTVVGDMAVPAPGIMVHSVMRIPGQQGEMLIRGKFPPDNKLLLYS